MIKILTSGNSYEVTDAFGKFPNGEIYPKNFVFAATTNIGVVWIFEEDKLYEDLFELEMMRGFVGDKSLLIGYLPYSRSDKPTERAVFMLKMISEKINQIGFAKVSICEPHSDMSLAFIDNCRQINVTSSIYHTVTMFEKNFVLVYPDLGAMKRYAKQITHSETICCMKERDVDGNIKSFQLLNPDGVNLIGRRFVIVDDLCSRGGTFWEILEKLSEHQPLGVDLIVTHLEDNVFSGNLLAHDLLSNVYTSNAVVRNGSSYGDDKIKEMIDIKILNWRM
jgi:ribose-phosphate pyrophosphokinase